MTFTVEAADGIGVDIAATAEALTRPGGVFKTTTRGALQTFVIVRDTGNPWRGNTPFDRADGRKQGQRVDEDIIVFFGFVMQVVTANAEVQRTAEFRGQPKLLAELPGMFGR